MDYTKEEVRIAETLLADSELAGSVCSFVEQTNASAEELEHFSYALPADLGSLLIAGTRKGLINFMDAHRILAAELQRGERLSYLHAAQDAYDILEGHDVITPENVRAFGEEVIPALAKGFPLPKKAGRILDFYEERAKLLGRA